MDKRTIAKAVIEALLDNYTITLIIGILFIVYGALTSKDYIEVIGFVYLVGSILIDEIRDNKIIIKDKND